MVDPLNTKTNPVEAQPLHALPMPGTMPVSGSPALPAVDGGEGDRSRIARALDWQEGFAHAEKVYQETIAAAESRVQSLEEEVKVLREALKPFAEYAPYVDMFVKGRAAQGGSPLLPTKHFRLSHFQAARAALKENG